MTVAWCGLALTQPTAGRSTVPRSVSSSDQLFLPVQKRPHFCSESRSVAAFGKSGSQSFPPCWRGLSGHRSVGMVRKFGLGSA